MALRLIPGKSYVDEPDSSGLYLVPGKGYVDIEGAATAGGQDAKLGATSITKLYVGPTLITKAYLGSTLVFDQT